MRMQNFGVSNKEHRGLLLYFSGVVNKKHLKYLKPLKKKEINLGFWQTAYLPACENIRFTSLFAARAVSRGGTSATQRQKFHTDDANQCLHNKSGSHGVTNVNLSNFARLLVDFGKVLC